ALPLSRRLRRSAEQEPLRRPAGQHRPVLLLVGERMIFRVFGHQNQERESDMRSHPLKNLVCLAVPTLLLVGCGGDDSSNPATSGKGGTIQVNISGEDLGTDGIAFPLSGEVA